MSRRMHLLLWLTACSALPGSRLPALKLRGGGVQQTLDALPHDAKALAKSFVVLGGFDKFVQHLAASETISRPAARKTMHVGAGPLFLLCWPLFSDAATAKNWAMIGPLALTLKAAAAGSGLIDDPKTVASMSRSGDRRELLRGPALYGAVFVAATPRSSGCVGTDHQPRPRKYKAKAAPPSVVATKNEKVPTTLFRRHHVSRGDRRPNGEAPKISAAPSPAQSATRARTPLSSRQHRTVAATKTAP